MAVEHDLILRWVVALNGQIGTVLQARCGDACVTGVVLSILMIAEQAVGLGILALGADELRSLAERVAARGRGRAVVGGLHALAVLGAACLLWWIARHPGKSLMELPARWDHLVFAMLLGAVLRGASRAVRLGTLLALSVAFVAQYVGPSALAVVLAACLVGWAAARWAPLRRPAAHAVVQAVVFGVVLAVLWRMRTRDWGFAVQGWGLLAFVLLRHVSAVVEIVGGARVPLGHYLTYQFFYPNCLGAVEVYPEFARHNLGGEPDWSYRQAVGRVVWGSVLLTLALRVPGSRQAMLLSTTTALAWGNLLLTFLQGALFSMGLWSTIEGGALFYGIRLRPNFSGVLTARSPSEFWRAWRGTLTNWLILYVYVPLGGNRRHRTLNILGAFAVSTAWHCAGFPFVHATTYTASTFAPIVAWGVVNFVGVAAHATVRRRWPPRDWSPPVAALVTGVKILLTLVFGALTVGLLGFSAETAGQFPHFACTLAGHPGRCGG